MVISAWRTSPTGSMPKASRNTLELPPLSQAGTMRVSRTPMRDSAMFMFRQAVPPEKSTMCGVRAIGCQLTR
jgi:hypothetical protein